MTVTHYVPAFAPTLGESQLSLCHRWVDPAREYAATPTCRECRTIIAEEDRQLAELRDMAPPVTPQSIAAAKAATAADRLELERLTGLHIGPDGQISWRRHDSPPTTNSEE